MNYLEVDDLSATELIDVLDRAGETKLEPVLSGKGVALVFEKPSARTRNSMEMAVVQLGGHPVTIRPDEIGLGRRERVEDLARMFGCYHAALGARVFDHDELELMASASPIPVINMLSDAAHPLQALADLLTIRQVFGQLGGLTVAYVGDGNNVCRSLCIAAGMAGMRVRVACPRGYELSQEDEERVSRACTPTLTSDPRVAVSGADVVYTDAWFSMGQESQAEARRPLFAPFQVDDQLMAAAGPDAIFLHCLPAHRDEEVTDSVLDGPQSRVWQQAENRMHASRGLLSWLMEH